MPVVPNRADRPAAGSVELPRDLVTRGPAAARNAIETEAAAVAALADRLDGVFLDVLTAVATCEGHLVVTGLGKSGSGRSQDRRDPREHRDSGHVHPLRRRPAR